LSASPSTPPAHRREGGSVRAPSGGDAARPRPRTLLVGSLLFAALAGCNGSGRVQVEPIATGSSPSATGSATPVSEQQAILSQYRTFWSSLTSVSRMPAAQRRTALAAYAVDPELKSLLAGMARIDAKGQTFYGAHIPRATSASISPDGLTAVVNDCQDSTRTGLARRSDLAPLTKGVARNHVVVTVKRSAGAWKIYFVSYTKTPC
jgi:hypothetical protein